ncbi:hypothetical protein [Nitratireductor sp. XY-223]|uniref:hypothetical protein n=1 Tax=Nitratireductor sp. XY-223 TaxID=2561926 RepID=UPI0010A9F7D7|nr:hypothetical protein [Nitratireductor sp. XY-223]
MAGIPGTIGLSFLVTLVASCDSGGNTNSSAAVPAPDPQVEQSTVYDEQAIAERVEASATTASKNPRHQETGLNQDEIKSYAELKAALDNKIRNEAKKPAANGRSGDDTKIVTATQETLTQTSALQLPEAEPQAEVAQQIPVEQAGPAQEPEVVVAEAQTIEEAILDGDVVTLANIPVPTPRPAYSSPGQQIAVQENPAPQQNASTCGNIAQITDRDGDFSRNSAYFRDDLLCVSEHRFKENGVNWIVHIIEHKDKRPGPLWAVPHDNENVAFDTALYGLYRYGGKIVSVDSAGKRLNAGIDPNRNFTGNKKACGRYSPKYTDLFMSAYQRGRPIVALHSNALKSRKTGGSGGVSINSPFSNTSVHKAKKPIPSQSNEDTLAFVASTKKYGADHTVDKRIASLNNQGINVMRELVSRRGNDCSLSNYASLTNIKDYFNLEVVHGDGQTHMNMVDRLMKILGY